MIKTGKLTLHSHMVVDYGFFGTTLHNNEIIPNHWSLSIDMGAFARPGATPEEVEEDTRTVALAYKRMRAWLDIGLNGVVFVDVSSDEDFAIAMHVTNPVVYVPGAITDELIAQLIHAKISALSGDALVMGAIRISSKQSSVSYTFSTSDQGYRLPETTKYFTRSKTKHSVPWWHRNDGFCLEIPVTESGEEIVVEDPLDFLSEEHTGPKASAGRMVRIDNWAPKKV